MRIWLIVGYLVVIALVGAALPDSQGPLWPAAFFLALALPAGVFGTYLATLRRAHWLTMWSADSLVVRLLSGAWLRLAIGLVLAFVTAALLCVRLSVAGWLDLTLVTACVVVVVSLRALFGAGLSKQFNPVYRHGQSLLVIALATALLMSLVDPVVRFAAGAFPIEPKLGETIAALRERGDWLGTSALVGLALDWGSLWSGLEQYALGRLIDHPGWMSWLVVPLSGLLRFPLYLAVCFSVAAFALPGREYSRMLQPSLSKENMAPLTSKKIALTSATATIGGFFIYLPLVGVLETSLEGRPDRSPPEASLVQMVEKVGDQYHSVGTIDAISQLAATLLADQHEVLGPVDAALSAGFSGMRANVDHYLDWYYSLPGEWTRLARLLTGDFEAFLAERLAASLSAGEPFAPFEREFASALDQRAADVAQFREQAQALLQARRVEVRDEEAVSVVGSAETERLLSVPVHQGLTSIEQRLGVTAATTGISGVVAAAATRQVLLRAASRGTLRTAANAIFRLTTVRAGSAGSGGALGGVIGGTLGSVMPGIGTAVGAVVGGAIGGLLVGVGAEYLILKLEEFWSREAHRAELLAAIDEAEANLRREFGLE